MITDLKGEVRSWNLADKPVASVYVAKLNNSGLASAQGLNRSWRRQSKRNSKATGSRNAENNVAPTWLREFNGDRQTESEARRAFFGTFSISIWLNHIPLNQLNPSLP